MERDDILRVAEQIHSHQDGVPPESKLELLLQVASKKNLIHCIEKYRLIPTIDQRPKNYPSNLTWKSNGKLQKVSEVIPDKYSFVAPPILIRLLKSSSENLASLCIIMDGP